MAIFTYAVGICLALYAAYDDARTHLLRNIYTGPLAAIAIVGFSVAAALDRTSLPIVAMAAGAAIFAGPWLASHLISPASTGFGDVKYSAALGLYLGHRGLSVAFQGLLLASLIGALMAAIPLLRRSSTPPEHLAFGPALAAGAILALGLSVITDA